MRFAVIYARRPPYPEPDLHLVEGALFETREAAERAAANVAKRRPGTKVYVAEAVLYAEVPLTVVTTAVAKET